VPYILRRNRRELYQRMEVAMDSWVTHICSEYLPRTTRYCSINHFPST
jgi:hypothetical protein